MAAVAHTRAPADGVSSRFQRVGTHYDGVRGGGTTDHRNRQVDTVLAAVMGPPTPNVQMS